jgi:type II secretion system protein C
MYLSYRFFKYMVVTVCGIFLAITTVVADESKESVIVEKTVTPEKNRDPEEQLSNSKIEQEELRRLMNFTLVGTVLSDAGKSIAIIEDNWSNEQKFYRLNDLIRGIRLTEIYKDRVVLMKNGVALDLMLNGGTNRSNDVPMEHESSWPRTELWVLEEIIRLEEFSLPVTQQEDGGFRVDYAEKDGLLDKLGLKTGTVINTFNTSIPKTGSSFSDAISQALSFSKDTLRLELEHNGKPEVVYIEVIDSSEKHE